MDPESEELITFRTRYGSYKCKFQMLAIIHSLQNWRSKLVGIRSTIKVFLDHKALEYFIIIKHLTSRHARWLEELN